MRFLSAPWRWKFISGAVKNKNCVFCDAQGKDFKESLVCYRGKKSFVILNKYPYNSGHLMVVPNQHVETPLKVDADVSEEMWQLMEKSITVLKNSFSPDGFNIGMNLGKAAGAGIKDHFHLHIVPRWQGDSNFMEIVGKTNVMSYDIGEIHEKLVMEFKKI